MQLTPEATAIIVVCATNVGALIWHAASVNARLTAVEQAMNNGITDEVIAHGQQITAIQTHCRDQHGPARVQEVD